VARVGDVGVGRQRALGGASAAVVSREEVGVAGGEGVSGSGSVGDGVDSGEGGGEPCVLWRFRDCAVERDRALVFATKPVVPSDLEPPQMFW
jgi:hypothetical protein